MPTFKGSYFQIELPDNASDQSTYAFAFPARGNFRPSVVVTSERLTQPTDLTPYVQQQLQKAKQLLPHMAIVSISEPTRNEMATCVTVYDFGEAVQRVRQKQLYVRVPDGTRIVTLTATNSVVTFAQTEVLFDAVFRTFRLLDAAGSPRPAE